MERIIQGFERIVIAFERMAAAAERSAAAAELQAGDIKRQADAVEREYPGPGLNQVAAPGTPAPPVNPPEQTPTPPAAAPSTPPATAPAAAPAAAPATPPATPPATAPGAPAAGTQVPGLETWNPYTDQKVTARYKEPKGTIMRNELVRRGVEGTEKLTGQQLHMMLLKMGPEAPGAPAAGAPGAPAAGAPGLPPGPAAGAPGTPQAAAPAMLPPDQITLDSVRVVLSDLMALGGAARDEGLGLLHSVGGVERLTDATTGEQLIPAANVVPLYYAVVSARSRYGAAY